MTSGKYDPSLLQLVSDWQRGAGDDKQRVKRGNRLKAATAALPEFFKDVNLVCHRQVALEKASVWNLLGKQSLAGRISSWTTNTAVAKTFLNGIPPVDDGLTHVIFALQPRSEQVVVSLSKLLRDEDYRRQLEETKGSIDYFTNGTGKHGNTQDEVVLEIDTLEEADIWVLGGWSSSFDDLVKRTFWLLHGHQPSESEFDELKASVAELSPEAGARWLQPESTLRVLSRMRPTVEALREIEQQREATRLARDKEVVE